MEGENGRPGVFAVSGYLEGFGMTFLVSQLACLDCMVVAALEMLVLMRRGNVFRALTKTDAS